MHCCDLTRSGVVGALAALLRLGKLTRTTFARYIKYLNKCSMVSGLMVVTDSTYLLTINLNEVPVVLRYER